MNTTTFADLALSSKTLSSIADMGFEAPTEIQTQCITKIMNGGDLVGQAQTGTGKTAAFGIPLIEKVNPDISQVQSLVLCPTRELAIQVTKELIKIGKHANGLHILPVYGGQSISHQIKALKRGAQIVVGTPGRTIDHLKRGTLKIGGLNTIVFDEADEMLNMGFRDDIETILSYPKGDVQTVMFSATVPKAIRGIMNRYMKQPETVQIKKKSITAPNIDQYVVEVRDSVRVEAISRFLDIKDYKLAIVFCNTRRETEQVTRELKARGYATDFLNGDMRQSQRDKVMNKFRQGDIEILVATDVAARGLDVEDVDVIFNYDVPQDPEYYVHRIGRTGRAGRSGEAITFVAGRKKKQLRYIEKNNKIKLARLELPSVQEVKDSKMEDFMVYLTACLEKGGLRPYIEMLENIDDPRFTTIEVAAALLKMQTDAKFKTETKQQNSIANKGLSSTQLLLNVGYRHKVGPGNILGAITGETGISGDDVGNIDISNDSTVVDLPNANIDKVINQLNGARIRGQRIQARKA